MSTTRTALQNIRTEVCSLYIERNELVDAIILGLLTRNNVSVVSPPGTAKSALTREVFSRIDGAKVFDVLLSKSRSDQAVLGPYNLPKLRDEGKFIRNSQGYLPTADYALLDEGSKMSPTLGHDLLAILNERIHHQVADDGSTSVAPVPLKTAVVTGNEAFTAQGDDAAALWDRLLIRVHLDYLESGGSFARMLLADSAPVARTTVSMADLDEAAKEVQQVTIPNAVVKAIVDLRKTLKDDGVIASDRRWRQSMSIVKATAWLNDRTEAAINDVQSLHHTLWHEVDEIAKVKRACMDIADPYASRILDIADNVKVISAEVVSRSAAGDGAALYGYAAESSGKLKRAAQDLQTLRESIIADGLNTDLVDDAIASTTGAQQFILSTITGGAL